MEQINKMNKSLPDAEYSIIADSYAELIPTKAHNAYYERPAMLSILPDVKNKIILDAGCGTGMYTKILIEKGATVTGIDANEKMLKNAEKIIKNKAKLIHANLEEPLPFIENEYFDGIVSALTITYFNNLNNVFNEYYRIIKNKGWFLFSTEHPFFQYLCHKLDNYYNERKLEFEWKGFNENVIMKSYYHNLQTLTDALTNNNFLIEKILEPKPIEQFKDTIEGIDKYNRYLRFPLFICILARKIIY